MKQRGMHACRTLIGPVVKTFGRNLNSYLGRQYGERRTKHYLVFHFRFPLRVLLVLPVFLLQPLGKLAFAAAVHFGLVPVFAQVFGNKIPVGIKIQHDKRSVECLAQKSEQQQYGSGLPEQEITFQRKDRISGVACRKLGD